MEFHCLGVIAIFKCTVMNFSDSSNWILPVWSGLSCPLVFSFFFFLDLLDLTTDSSLLIFDFLSGFLSSPSVLITLTTTVSFSSVSFSFLESSISIAIASSSDYNTVESSDDDWEASEFSELKEESALSTS